jgi:Rrf2 family protein
MSHCILPTFSIESINKVYDLVVAVNANQGGDSRPMRISAKTDYAIRAVLELAAAPDPGLVSGDDLASRQDIPRNFLTNILVDLRRAGIVRASRGAAGGYQLARPATQISVADIVRAIDGPLAAVQGDRPETLTYDGAATGLTDVWIAVRASLRAVLEQVTLDQIVRDELPPSVTQHIRHRDAWRPH